VRTGKYKGKNKIRFTYTVSQAAATLLSQTGSRSA